MKPTTLALILDWGSDHHRGLGDLPANPPAWAAEVAGIATSAELVGSREDVERRRSR
jgi:hypothetical protein